MSQEFFCVFKRLDVCGQCIQKKCENNRKSELRDLKAYRKTLLAKVKKGKDVFAMSNFDVIFANGAEKRDGRRPYIRLSREKNFKLIPEKSFPIRWGKPSDKNFTSAVDLIGYLQIGCR